MNHSDFKSAITQNDLAHRKTIQEAARKGDLTTERMIEIGEESKLWLRHLFFIHNATCTKNEPELQ